MWQGEQTLVRVGGGIIPFTIAPVSNRCTLNSQNCYLWNDNGTPKMHIEFEMRTTSSISSNTSFATGIIPFNPSHIEEENVLPDGLSVYVSNSVPLRTLLRRKVAMSSGTTFSVNTDVVCNFGNS